MPFKFVTAGSLVHGFFTPSTQFLTLESFRFLNILIQLQQKQTNLRRHCDTAAESRLSRSNVEANDKSR